jgi:hypothetical protein
MTEMSSVPAFISPAANQRPAVVCSLHGVMAVLEVLGALLRCLISILVSLVTVTGDSRRNGLPAIQHRPPSSREPSDTLTATP